jgi:hypothetical protein
MKQFVNSRRQKEKRKKEMDRINSSVSISKTNKRKMEAFIEPSNFKESMDIRRRY